MVFGNHSWLLIHIPLRQSLGRTLLLMHLPWSRAEGTTIKMKLLVLMQVWLMLTMRRERVVLSRAMSKYVTGLIPMLFTITMMTSWQLFMMPVHPLPVQSTPQLLTATFHHLSCFKKLRTWAWKPSPDHLQLWPLILKPPLLPCTQPLHHRKCRKSVLGKRHLLMKTELRQRFLWRLQLRNMLGRWLSMCNGWLS